MDFFYDNFGGDYFWNFGFFEGMFWECFFESIFYWHFSRFYYLKIFEIDLRCDCFGFLSLSRRWIGLFVFWRGGFWIGFDIDPYSWRNLITFYFTSSVHKPKTVQDTKTQAQYYSKLTTTTTTKLYSKKTTIFYSSKIAKPSYYHHPYPYPYLYLNENCENSKLFEMNFSSILTIILNFHHCHCHCHCQSHHFFGVSFFVCFDYDDFGKLGILKDFLSNIGFRSQWRLMWCLWLIQNWNGTCLIVSDGCFVVVCCCRWLFFFGYVLEVDDFAGCFREGWWFDLRLMGIFYYELVFVFYLYTFDNNLKAAFKNTYLSPNSNDYHHTVLA